MSQPDQDPNRDDAVGPAQREPDAEVPTAPERQTVEAGEAANPRQDSVQNLHTPIYREKSEPRDGSEPIPIALMFVFFALLMWGGWYLGTQSAQFQPDVYDSGDPGEAEVAAAQEVDLMKLGGRVYNNCVACHQRDGQGVAGQFPPLAGSGWVEGDPRLLARILLQGMQGPVEVLGEQYNGQMPGWAHLSDQQIAAVLTYTRQSWDNYASEVSPELIASVRQEVGPRREAWTADELKALLQELPPLDDATAEDTAATEPASDE